MDADVIGSPNIFFSYRALNLYWDLNAGGSFGGKTSTEPIADYMIYNNGDPGVP